MTHTPNLLTAYRDPPEAPLGVAPLTGDELVQALYRPDRALELFLAQRLRLRETLVARHNLPLLACALLVSSALLSLPFGAVLGFEGMVRIPLLFLGSVAICFPSLHVVSSYLGARTTLSQNLVLSLLVCAVASFFVLGFAPILWFVHLTTAAGSLALGTVAVILLATALFAGLAHLSRIILDDARLLPDRGHRVFIFAWQGLLVFVAHRLASYLGLP